jgi:hypothetical protein
MMDERDQQLVRYASENSQLVVRHFEQLIGPIIEENEDGEGDLDLMRLIFVEVDLVEEVHVRKKVEYQVLYTVDNHL